MKKAFILLLACLMLLASAAAAEECRIPGSMGDIYTVLKMPQADGPVPLVILCHGFGGSHAGNQARKGRAEAAAAGNSGGARQRQSAGGSRAGAG